jgi:hypothetical protein
MTLKAAGAYSTSMMDANTERPAPINSNRLLHDAEDIRKLNAPKVVVLDIQGDANAANHPDSILILSANPY